MADLVRLAYYPFLPEVKDAVRELGPDMGQVLGSPVYEGVRRRGAARIHGALDDRRIPATQITDERGALQELLSVPIARMLAVLIGDRTLVQRYGAAEAARLEETLLHDPGSTEGVAAGLRLPVQRTQDAWRIHFSDYLRFAPLRDEGWKLILRPVDRGWVPLSGPSVARLCREALERRITDELMAERGRPVHDDVRTALQPHLDDLGPRLAKAREHWQTGDFGPVRKELFPPCITQLFADMKDGKMIPHHGRFAIASFLGTIGMDSDQVIEYFTEIPNFDADKSRYQIEHILGERGVDPYTPPGCATMQTHGICPLEQRDGLCFKIKHPLSYYRARVRFAKQDEDKAKHMIAARRRHNRQGEAVAEPAGGRRGDTGGQQAGRARDAGPEATRPRAAGARRPGSDEIPHETGREARHG